MRFIYLLLLATVLFSPACGDDDDGTGTSVVLLGRFEGWQLAQIGSNLEASLSDAIGTIPDSTLAAYDTTRQQLLDASAAFVEATVGLQPCEQDDVVFFDNGIVAYGQDGEPCPANSGPSVLMPFDTKTYSTDLQVTDLTITDPATQTNSVYRVDLLTEESLVITQTRVVPESLPVPEYRYEITYRFTAR